MSLSYKLYIRSDYIFQHGAASVFLGHDRQKYCHQLTMSGQHNACAFEFYPFHSITKAGDTVQLNSCLAKKSSNILNFVKPSLFCLLRVFVPNPAVE